MATKPQRPSRRMKPIADPETIDAIIQRREDDDEPLTRLRIEIGKALSPAGLVSELVQLHNVLNTQGPTDEWDDARRWLFSYVDMYKSQLAMEDKAPEDASRMPFIEASEPFSDTDRRSVAEAQSLKKQIGMQVRGLRARNIWW